VFWLCLYTLLAIQIQTDGQIDFRNWRYEHFKTVRLLTQVIRNETHEVKVVVQYKSGWNSKFETSQDGWGNNKYVNVDFGSQNLHMDVNGNFGPAPDTFLLDAVRPLISAYFGNTHKNTLMRGDH